MESEMGGDQALLLEQTTINRTTDHVCTILQYRIWLVPSKMFWVYPTFGPGILGHVWSLLCYMWLGNCWLRCWVWLSSVTVLGEYMLLMGIVVRRLILLLVRPRKHSMLWDFSGPLLEIFQQKSVLSAWSFPWYTKTCHQNLVSSGCCSLTNWIVAIWAELHVQISSPVVHSL